MMHLRTHHNLAQGFENKPYSLTLPIIIILSLIFLAVITFFITGQKSGPDKIACTLEAKICPDGSQVGRTGPKCEFEPCPSATPDQWQVFEGHSAYNPEARFTMNYPANWNVTGDRIINLTAEDNHSYQINLEDTGHGTSVTAEFTQTTINSLPATKILERNMEGNIIQMYISLYDEATNADFVFSFEVPEVNQDKYLQIFDQMLSTLQLQK